MKSSRLASRLLIIGLDGASWEIIDPLIQQGQLPHIARLVREGARGKLRSLEPMISTMLWTTISSGKLPDKHGVRDFSVSSHSVLCKRIWDIVAQQHCPVGVYGHMITWPPDPLEGFMIPGTFAMGPETHPPELSFLRKLVMSESSEEKKRYGHYLQYGWKALRHGVGTQTLSLLAAQLLHDVIAKKDPLADFYRKRELKLRLDREVFSRLCRRYKPQLAYFYTHLVDSSQHLFWKYFEPDAFDVNESEIARYGSYIPAAYREVDRSIGHLLSRATGFDAVMVVSDHGGQALPQRKEGFALTIKTENLLRALDLWEKIRAVNIGFELYLCPLRDEPDFGSRIQELLGDVVIEGTKTRVFQITKADYSYTKIHIKHEDVPKLRNALIRVKGTTIPFEQLVEISLGDISGCHHPDGICILWGKSIQSGIDIDQASILDVTPTSLMLMGLPVAKDMDGKPLTQAVKPSFLKAHPLRYCETYEDERRRGVEEDAAMPEELAEKLRALGYLG